MILPYLRHRQMAKNAKSYGPSHQTLTNDAPYNRIYIHTREYRSCCIIRLVYNRTTQEFLDDKMCIKLPMTAMSVLK